MTRQFIPVTVVAIVVLAVLAAGVFVFQDTAVALELPLQDVLNNFTESVQCNDRLALIEFDILDKLKQYTDAPSPQTLEVAFGAIDTAEADLEALTLPVNRFSDQDFASFAALGISFTDFDYLFSLLSIGRADLISKADNLRMYLDIATSGPETFQTFAYIVKNDLAALEISTQIYYLMINGILCEVDPEVSDSYYISVISPLASYTKYGLPWDTEPSAIEGKMEVLLEKLEKLITELSTHVGELETDILDMLDMAIGHFYVLTPPLECLDGLFLIESELLNALGAYTSAPSSVTLSAAYAAIDKAQASAEDLNIPDASATSEISSTVSFFTDIAKKDRQNLIDSADRWRERLDIVSSSQDEEKIKILKSMVDLLTARLPVYAKWLFMTVNNFLLFEPYNAEIYWEYAIMPLTSCQRYALPWESDRTVVTEKQDALFEELKRFTSTK